MARDKYGRTLNAGDPVSIGDKHIPGVVRTAQVAQTCITVDWTPKDAYDSTCEGSMVEFWGPEQQAKWAEARDADMPAIVAPAPVEPPAEAPKPKAPAMVTKRDAHPHKG